MENEELRLLSHTLGYRLEAKSWSLESYRNVFVATVGSRAEDTFQALVQRGLAEQAGKPSFISSENVVFRATELGHRVVLDTMASLPHSTRLKIACGRA